MGKQFLQKKMALREKGCPTHLAPLEPVDVTSQHKMIMDAPYDKDLLTQAVSETSGGKTLEKSAADLLWKIAEQSGNADKHVEYGTLDFILAAYKCSDDAHELLESKLKDAKFTRKFVGTRFLPPDSSLPPAKKARTGGD